MKLKTKILSFIAILTAVGFGNNLMAQDKKINIKFQRNADKSVDFYYEKELPGSYYLSLIFNNLENTFASNYEGVIKYASGSILTLTPNNKDRDIIFSYSFSTLRGTPNPKVDSLFNYTLPFKKGKTIKILENSNLGEKYFGSERPSKFKSYMTNRTIPDTVCSMRKGIVVEIKNEFACDTLDQYKYNSRMNYVVIEHSDGTFAFYKGFKKDLIFVQLGQTVYPQTQLGILDKFNNSTYRLYFCIYYLINKDFDLNNNATLKTFKSREEYLSPYFITAEGQTKLKHNNNYTIDFNETMLFYELTKKERNKCKKNTGLLEK